MAKRGRPATYTEEEAKTRQLQAQKEWRKENLVVIKVNAKPDYKKRLEAYAEHKGIALSALLKECAERCMILDGWSYNPVEDQTGEEVQSNE